MTLSDPQTISALAVLVVLTSLGVILAVVGARRHSMMRMPRHYVREKDRTIASSGSRRAAQAQLSLREERRKRLRIKPLPGGLREGYVARWKAVQARFVDQPQKAIWEANELVQRVMEERGYPMRDLEGRADDLSVDYGPLVADYRQARAVASVSGDDGVSTEDLRSAFLLYRSMFDALLDSGEGEASSESRFERESPHSRQAS